MKLRKIIIICTALVCVAAFAVADDVDALRKEAERIGSNMKDNVGSNVDFIDDVLFISKHQDVKNYLKFNTKNLRCIIGVEKKTEIELLKKMLARKIEPRLLFFSGTVTAIDEFNYYCEISTLRRVNYKKDE